MFCRRLLDRTPARRRDRADALSAILLRDALVGERGRASCRRDADVARDRWTVVIGTWIIDD